MTVLWEITLADNSHVYRQNETMSKPFDLQSLIVRAMSEKQYKGEKKLKRDVYDTIVNPHQIIKSEIIKIGD